MSVVSISQYKKKKCKLDFKKTFIIMGEGMGLTNHSANARRLEEEKEKQIRQEKEDKEKREHKSYEISEGSYIWTKRGIWITVVLAVLQIGISIYDIWVKDNEHETTMIKQNAIQIEQNKKIIELLEQNK